MSKRFALVLPLLAVAACAEPGGFPTGVDATVVIKQAAGGNYGTHLKGDEEVPVRETNAQGQAIFRLSADGQSLYYKLIVANIENVIMAHIHAAPAGVNGGIVLWLYGNCSAPTTCVAFASGGGRVNGVLAEGVVTSANLVGALAGTSLSDLVALIESQRAYVNVHTNDGVAPTNTGPGDFPGGEVRGQLDTGHAH
ncbi:MAG TPA: CHRD domain-containing protein [Gemmatimonadaceae bacterium]|nr:CHRD domain-containing protein [Gemmatimonadaceae bacterium]